MKNESYEGLEVFDGRGPFCVAASNRNPSAVRANGPYLERIGRCAEYKCEASERLGSRATRHKSSLDQRQWYWILNAVHGKWTTTSTDCAHTGPGRSAGHPDGCCR